MLSSLAHITQVIALVIALQPTKLFRSGGPILLLFIAFFGARSFSCLTNIGQTFLAVRGSSSWIST